MIIGISGTISSGQSEVVNFLVDQGFTYVAYKESSNLFHNTLKFKSQEELIDHVTLNWTDNFVTSHLDDAHFLEQISIRPFFLHVTVDGPIVSRFQRHNEKYLTKKSLEEFVTLSDETSFGKLSGILPKLDLKIMNDKIDIAELHRHLETLQLLDHNRLRPSWDQYFMEIADLASRRSNCMKRRVGCVIVRDNRIISTGYNGTPRNLPNCNEGGCERCNKCLDTNCLCLHLEENALLESGRERVGANSVLYCNTCPCLQCTIKIIQTGISSVVYKNEYKFDEHSKLLLDQAGITVRRFQPLEL